MMFMHPTPMRHTQQFTCHLLLATMEWLQSELRSTLGQAEIFYHCVSSNTLILIELTKQVTQLALMQATPGSVLTVVSRIPLFGSLSFPITWQHGSPSAQPHQINSCWYVADTPGPVIIGLPSHERLEFIKMSRPSQILPSCLVSLQHQQHHLHPGKLLQSSLQRTSSRSSQIGFKA